MENQTAFDLNSVITRWRENLGQSAAFRAADLDELESHLRDAIRELESRGLSPEEAFTIGIWRIGDASALAAEFGRANGYSPWIDRVLWMLAGWVTISTIQAGIASFGLLVATTRLTGFLSTSIIVVAWASPLLLAALVLLLMGPWNADFLHGPRKWLRNPAPLAASAFVVLMLSAGFRYLTTMLLMGSNRSWSLLSRGYIGSIVAGPDGARYFGASSLFLSLLGWLSVPVLILIFAKLRLRSVRA